MSIFIKDIDVPESCSECELSYDYHCFLTWKMFDDSIDANGINAYNRERLVDCPLVDGKPYEDAFVMQEIRMGGWNEEGKI